MAVNSKEIIQKKFFWLHSSPCKFPDLLHLRNSQIKHIYIYISPSEPSASIDYLFSSAPAPAPKPAPAPVRPKPVAPAPSPPRQEVPASVTGIFGTGGANNVRLESPEVNYAFDL